MTGLPGEHDYAVMAFSESSGKRLFLVKNPWSDVDACASLVAGHNPVDDADQISEDTPREEKQPKVKPGTFWMSLQNIFQHFESLYLNWNPSLFSYRDDVHFTWNIAKTNGLWASFANNPQYQVHSKAGGTVWMVLSRHFKSHDRGASGIDQDATTVNAVDAGFISMYLFQNGGEKVYLTEGSCIQGPYVDSPNSLLKFELPGSVTYTVVVSEQELYRSSHSFTLSAFSLKPLVISEVRDRYHFYAVQTGAWTPATAGGNSNSPSYSKNPQFSIDLSRPSNVSVLLELHSEDFPVHVKLIWSDGKPVRFMDNCRTIGDSGKYRKGHAFAELSNVPTGRYSIICSTFEQGQLGKFTVQVGTMSDCVLQRVSRQPAGRFVARPHTAFFVSEVDRLWAPLRCTRLTRLSVVAQSCVVAGSPSIRSNPSSLPLRLSVESGRGLTQHILASSGSDEFSDGHYGIQIDDVDIQPVMCAQVGVRIVIERAGPLSLNGREGVDVEIYSDANIEVGSWSG